MIYSVYMCRIPAVISQLVSTIILVVRQPRSGWTVEHRQSGATFEDVDLAEKEWADYDERSQEAVGITDLEFQFVKVK